MKKAANAASCDRETARDGPITQRGGAFLITTEPPEGKQDSAEKGWWL